MMRNPTMGWMACGIIVALLLCACNADNDAARLDQQQSSLDDLDRGWNKVTPNGEAICSNGTDYAFFVRPADPEKLLIYFQPGGGCWKGENCDLAMQPTYDPVVREDDNPAENPHGIFNLNHPENPFADYSMVFVSYCTADDHLGDTVRTYVVPPTDSTESREVRIYHKGYDNARTVLNWTFNSFDSPDSIFVTGSSAGAMSSAFYASIVADAYPVRTLRSWETDSADFAVTRFPLCSQAGAQGVH